MSSKSKKSSTATTGPIVWVEGATPAQTAGIVDAVTHLRSGDYSDREAWAKAFTAASKAEGKARRMARIYGAVALHAAYAAGDIGTGDAQVSQNAWAKAHGMSAANASGLRSLGHALSVGFGPDFPMWGKASDKATNAKVAEALRTGTDGADVDKLVQKALTAPRAARPDDGSTSQTDEGTEAATVPVDPFMAAKEAVRVLDTFLKSTGDDKATPEQREQREAILHMVENLTVREATLDQARSVKATPKPPSRKVTVTRKSA